MFANTYDVELVKDGAPVTVSLRITAGAQIKMKKRWNEPTTATLFNSIDDIERFVDVLNYALNWNGNKNTIHSGEDLADLLADNDMLGMIAKQRFVTALGRASGLLSEEEKNAIDKRSDELYNDMTKEDDQGNA